MEEYKRRVDLSTSSLYKLRRCEDFMCKTSTRITPATVLLMLKDICEVRNKALPGTMKPKAGYCVRNTYFKRDAKADLALFWRTLRRKFKGKLPKAYRESEIYYKKQQRYFKNLRRIATMDAREVPRVPGNTSSCLAGV